MTTSPAPALPDSALRVQEALRAVGHDTPIVTFDESTRTAAEAAAAIGCAVAEIAKSVVFKTKASSWPVLVIASGINRVNEKAVARALADHIGGEKIGRADADFVRAATGFAIGGVPPIGHKRPADGAGAGAGTAPPIRIVIDQDLLQYETIWAAAGTPNAVFRSTPAALVSMTGGLVAAIAAPVGGQGAPA